MFFLSLEIIDSIVILIFIVGICCKSALRTFTKSAIATFTKFALRLNKELFQMLKIWMIILFKRQFNAIANRRGDFVNHDQIALQIPNTVESLSSYAWMVLFFDLMGDVQPNKKEIHREAISKKEVYDEVFMLKLVIIPKYLKI